LSGYSGISACSFIQTRFPEFCPYQHNIPAHSWTRPPSLSSPLHCKFHSHLYHSFQKIVSHWYFSRKIGLFFYIRHIRCIKNKQNLYFKINNPAASYLAALDFATRNGVLNYQFKRLRSKLRGIEPKKIESPAKNKTETPHKKAACLNGKRAQSTRQLGYHLPADGDTRFVLLPLSSHGYLQS